MINEEITCIHPFCSKTTTIHRLCGWHWGVFVESGILDFQEFLQEQKKVKYCGNCKCIGYISCPDRLVPNCMLKKIYVKPWEKTDCENFEGWSKNEN